MSRNLIKLSVSAGFLKKFSLTGFDEYSNCSMNALEIGLQGSLKSKSLFMTMLEGSDIEIYCSNENEIKFSDDTISTYLEFNRCEDEYKVIFNKYEENTGVLVQKIIEPIKEVDIHDALKEYVENYDNAWDYFTTNRQGKNHPIIPKCLLSREIVERFHGKESARKSFDDWLYEFNNRRPINIEEKTIWYHEESIKLKSLLKDSGLVATTSEALRLIKQKGIKIDGVLAYEDFPILPDNIYRTYQVGKKKFLKIRVSKSKGYL